ncbi:MAG: hypothetical protein ACOYJ1_15585 [Peptococcales bacterium]|jgi:hypothetical protein
MKLGTVLNLLNQNEKSRFVNILTSQILDSNELLTKKTDTEAFVETFNNPEIRKKYKEVIRKALRDDIKLDIAADIFMADGKGFMSRDDLSQDYSKKIKELNESSKELLAYKNDEKNVNDPRLRDYNIYAECLKTAVKNDEERQAEGQISFDELTVLDTLRHALGLSDIESRILWMEYSKEKVEISVDELIASLVSKGICFYKKSSMMIYIPDEFVRILRELRGLRLPFKYQRRIYNALNERMLNIIIKKYRIRLSKITSPIQRKDKINAILNQYIDIKQVLSEDIFLDTDGVKERKDKLADIIENRLKIQLEKQGRNISEKIDYLIDFYMKDELEGASSLSKDGYNRLLGDLIKCGYEPQIREELSLHKGIKNIDAQTLLDLLIKPRDILYLFSQVELESFSSRMQFKVSKKDPINSILAAYMNAEDKLIENYTFLAANNVNALNDAGAGVASAEIGVTFEKITKIILTRLGVPIDEEIRNVTSENPDIVLKYPEGIFICECKSSRKQYAKFSSVTRQIGAYIKAYQKKGYPVLGSILISDSFSSDFIQDCQMFTDFILCLIKAEDLKYLYDEMRDQIIQFPYTRFLNMGMLDPEVTLKALKR